MGALDPSAARCAVDDGRVADGGSIDDGDGSDLAPEPLPATLGKPVFRPRGEVEKEFRSRQPAAFLTCKDGAVARNIPPAKGRSPRRH